MNVRGSAGTGVAAYYCRTHLLDAHHTDAALYLLSAEERRRCDWFFRESDRRDYVAAHALLRAALSAQTSIEPDRLAFIKDGAGRPSLVPTPPEGDAPTFSLSHTAGLVACVIASARDAPGIDVETIEPAIDVMDIARHVCSPEELARLCEGDAAMRPTRFFELWTLKEALLKAQGAGLSEMSMLMSFRVDGEHVRASLPPVIAERCWSFLVTALGATHVLSVAIAGPGTRVPIRMMDVDPVAAMRGALIPIRCVPASETTGSG